MIATLFAVILLSCLYFLIVRLTNLNLNLHPSDNLTSTQQSSSQNTTGLYYDEYLARPVYTGYIHSAQKTDDNPPQINLTITQQRGLQSLFEHNDHYVIDPKLTLLSIYSNEHQDSRKWSIYTSSQFLSFLETNKKITLVFKKDDGQPPSIDEAQNNYKFYKFSIIIYQENND